MIIFNAVIFLSMALLNYAVGKFMIKAGRGYNSFGRAMASEEAQNFAARTYGVLLVKSTAPVIMITLAALVVNFLYLRNITIEVMMVFLLTALHCVIHIVFVVRTEKRLRRYFDKNGNKLIYKPDKMTI